MKKVALTAALADYDHVRDLALGRVQPDGIPEWAQTAAVYSRGFLQHQYGIDLASIQWVQAGVNQPGRIEKVDVDLPRGVKLSRISDKSLNQMLLSGEVDAALVARPPDAFVNGDDRVRRLFTDYRQVEQDYYKQTGIFPIMHAVAVRRDVLHSHPWVPRNLFKAFDEAKRRSIARALEGTASLFPMPWGNAYAEETMQLLGKDYFPYGIEENRTTLAAFLRYAHEQRVCRRLLDVEELSPPQLHSTYRV